MPDLLADFRAFCYARDVEAAYAEANARLRGTVNAQDQHNLVRFLIDLANGAGTPNRPEDHARASARLRGDQFRPSPEATDGQKRTPGGRERRRWPVRAWWNQ